MHENFFLAAQTYICVSIVNQHTHPRACKIRIIYASVQKSYLSSGLYGKPRNFSCDLNLFILIIVMLGVCQLTFEGGGVIWYSHEPFLTLSCTRNVFFLRRVLHEMFFVKHVFYFFFGSLNVREFVFQPWLCAWVLFLASILAVYIYNYIFFSKFSHPPSQNSNAPPLRHPTLVSHFRNALCK